MDITPELHVLESRKNDRLGWHDCLAELIDNAFDAGASRAVIEWRDKRFSIEDDGKGMADVSVVLRLGAHKRQDTTALGMYGIGVKDAWLWLSSGIDIRTTRDGVTTCLKLSTSDIETVDGRWIVDDPIVRTASKGEIGTSITFGPLYSHRKIAQQDTFDRLAVTFMPALNAGKQIVRVVKGKRQPLVPYRLPAMQEAVEESFEVDGKPVSIHVGLAQDGERVAYPGLFVCYKHRVIKVSDIGTKHYNADRVIGRITLGNGWSLTPHKNDFADHCDALEEAIFQRIESLLKKSDQLSDIVESNAIRAELESMVNECVRDATVKEKRPGQRGQSVGTVMPSSTPKRRRKAAVVDDSKPGSVDATERRRRGFQIKWAALGDTLLGKCYSETRTVQLNVENPFVRAMKEQKNRAALFAVAVGLLCHADDVSDGAQRLVIPKGEFAESWGAIMSTIKIQESENVNAN